MKALGICSLAFFHQVNPELKQHLEEKGLHFVGQDQEGERMEMIELEGWLKEQYFIPLEIYQNYSFLFCFGRSCLLCRSAVPSRVYLSPH